MAPNSKDATMNASVDSAKLAELLQLPKFRKEIPEEAFVKSLPKSLFYMMFDLSAWGGSVFAMYTLQNSGHWQMLPFWAQALTTLAFWNIAGFFLWCIFVVGHDCGHGTFSDFQLLNDILGHFLHGLLFVPYYPWQMSHHRHHQYHNHVDKDYSFPWYTKEMLKKGEDKWALIIDANPGMRGLFPYFGWSVYLYGMPDGSHFWPFVKQRLWIDVPKDQHYKCFISSVSVIIWAAGIFVFCKQNIATMAYYHLAPLMMMGWWLVCVTYLQHHAPDTLVYDNNDWKFVDAAFETVDRKFGFGIDTLHHHITDGHVVHHLFFTKIPHYNLPMATKAIRNYMKKNNIGHVYKFENTYDFMWRVHKYFLTHGFRCITAAESKKKN